MKKILLTALTLGIVIAGTAVVFGQTSQDQTQPMGTTTTDDGGIDISGPCDEAEHANDPRCTGTAIDRDDRFDDDVRDDRDDRFDDDRFDDDRGVDISGPCDEAEHANDPRCTGAPRVDNSGPGSIDDDRFDDDRDDDWDDHHDDDRWDDSGHGHDDHDRWDDD